MSAFVVSKSHIDAMVNAGLSVMPRRGGPLSWYAKDPRKLNIQELQGNYRQLTNDVADTVGQMLVDECIKSVSYRYQDDDLTNLPGPNNAYWVIPYKHGFQYQLPSAVETLKLIDCYIYQSCEHPEFYESEAYHFCEALRHAMINLLPGYEVAPWGWEGESSSVIR